MDPRGVAERIASRLEGRVEEYLVIVEFENRRMLKLANGEATVTQSWRETTAAVYVARSDGRTFYTSIRSPTPWESTNNIVALLDKVRPSPLYAPLPEASGESYSNVDPVIEGYLSGELELDLAGDLELESAGNLAGMAELGVYRRVLLNSHGDMLEGAGSWFRGYARVFASDRSGQWSWTSARYEQGVLARRAIQTAREIAEECARLPRGKLEPGRYRVLLSPMIAGNLIGELVEAASAARILFGMSFLRPDSVGKRVFSESLTVWDEPGNKSLPEYRLHDDEGVRTRDKPVVERGVLRTLLHNTKTARKMGGETTGNAGIVFPRPFNIRVEPGSLGDSELMEALGDGVYITNNWYTRYQNAVEGTFSTVSRDAVFLVKGGRPSACLERIRLTGRLPELFNRVEAVGKTVWPLQWWEIAHPSIVPHILVGEAELSLPLV